MKNNFINTLLVLVVLVTVSCTKTNEYTATRTYVTAEDALLKINYLSAYVANPGVQLSINNTRVSGVITGRTPFPGGGYNTNGDSRPDYLSVTPGANTLSIAIPKKGTNTDSVVLFSTSLTLVKGRNYTVHLSDTLAKTKALLIEDELAEIEPNYARYRFVNMMPNAPLVDLYYGTKLVATGIPYLGYSAYFNLPYTTVATPWDIRETGTLPTSTALASYPSINTTLNQRMYTVFALGYKGATAATTKPYVSFLLNK